MVAHVSLPSIRIHARDLYIPRIYTVPTQDFPKRFLWPGRDRFVQSPGQFSISRPLFEEQHCEGGLIVAHVRPHTTFIAAYNSDLKRPVKYTHSRPNVYYNSHQYTN